MSGRKREATDWRTNVLDFGVEGDGRTVSTAGFQKAIDRVHGVGGGTVYVPPGNYVTGTLELKGNVTLYLEAGATVTGSSDRADYAHDCLIFGREAHDAAICGRGTLDGSGPAFWARRPDGLYDLGPWRPNNMLRFVRCDNLLLAEVTLRNSPAWTVHPIGCDGLTIRGISIVNGITRQEHGPNTDGINPDACTRVRISDCYIQSGDDSIVLKVTEEAVAEGRRECRDVTVTNCVLMTWETALKIGSESFGEFRNIAFSNCVVRDAGCGVGLWMRDGGLIDGFTVNNIAMTLPHGGVPIYFWSWRRTDDTPWGTVRNVMVSNVTATADALVFMSGVKERPMEGITLENLRLFVGNPVHDRNHANPPYPFTVWGHQSSPFDIYCRYVNGLKLRNIHATWGEPEKPWGSVIRCLGISDLEIAGFEGRQTRGSDRPAILLTDVRGAFIHGCIAPRETGTFLRLEGTTADVTLSGNDLSRAAAVAEFGPTVDSKELFQEGNRAPSSRSGKKGC